MSQQPKQFFCFDMPRTRSHLFFRFMGTLSNSISYPQPFMPAVFFGPERISIRFAESTSIDKGDIVWPTSDGPITYAGVTGRFLKTVEEAKNQHKALVTHEHSPFVLKQEIVLRWLNNENIDALMQDNPTVLPDHFLDSLVPIFVIRQPVFSASSFWRGLKGGPTQLGGETWRVHTSLPLQRRLFDYFLNRDGVPPTVVDGDDLVWRTTEVHENLSRALNIDPRELSLTWKARPEEERHELEVVRFFFKDADDSTGVHPPSEHPPDADLDKAYGEWVPQYGEEKAQMLKSTVEENLPHYEYMAQFKI